jgi:ergothioneine biosynthesis protein EgtB
MPEVPLLKSMVSAVQVDLAARFKSVRRRTASLCDPLTPEDMMVQSCPEASPAKWHLAHTTWFFESFILSEFLPGYRLFNPDFLWLFNSYYESFSKIPEKHLRASFSRPGLDEILRYRKHVDTSIERLLESDLPAEVLGRIELGANHEEQHQELFLTDILHAFFTNPLRPVYREDRYHGAVRESEGARLDFQAFQGGLREVGHDGKDFRFDNESPRHRVWLEPYKLARRLVTCGEYADFMADGGYNRAELWLSDGWAVVRDNGWQAPMYWSQEGGQWAVFTLRGAKRLEELADAPVGHVSFYEADAFARWAGCRLPTEFEWEAAAQGAPIEGNLLDSRNLRPIPAAADSPQSQRRTQLFGDCWEWTASSYLGYPGFKPLAGSLGEYNGKFMSGQMVLRGGSCVTPFSHIRATYRNFFAPQTRWQFSGIRLAR